MKSKELTLVIGDKNLSSWSLRPWLALKHSGIAFKEINIQLDRPTTKKSIYKYSPSGRVPVLIHENTHIWDSLSICEYIAELALDNPSANSLYPTEPHQRALVRSYMAEMHSSFSGLRTQLSMDVNLRMQIIHLTNETIKDIERILTLWRLALQKSKGPYLFGEFSNADAFFAPVIFRFQSYGIKSKNTLCQKYIKTMLNDKFMKEWAAAAKKEKPFIKSF